MKIGLIDVDSKKLPNIPLMKISAYHKSLGDTVVWYENLLTGHCDRVYVSKIFSFSPDYPYEIDADEIIRGGSGYSIKMVDGKEVYGADNPLPYEIEHTFPDYSIYGLTDLACGFLSRGCPRACPFCHVSAKEGRVSHRAADITEFWNGQKKIELFDPNVLACKEHVDLLRQAADTKAWVNFNQGIDCRFLNEDNVHELNKVKMRVAHFAWDLMKETDDVIRGLDLYKAKGRVHNSMVVVYILTNFNTTLEEDLYRAYKIREYGFIPYTMIYEKSTADTIHKQFARWTNNIFIWNKCERFEDYNKK